MSVESPCPAQLEYSLLLRNHSQVVRNSLPPFGVRYFRSFGQIHSRTSSSCLSRMALAWKALVYNANRLCTLANFSWWKSGVDKGLFHTNISLDKKAKYPVELPNRLDQSSNPSQLLKGIWLLYGLFQDGLLKNRRQLQRSELRAKDPPMCRPLYRPHRNSFVRPAKSGEKLSSRIPEQQITDPMRSSCTGQERHSIAISWQFPEKF